MELLWQILSWLTVILIFIFCIDDLFIDFIAWAFQLKPQKVSRQQLSQMHNLPQKRIAIMIANWHEADIIERMIHGNTGRIDYQNYDIYLGVYPNDIQTVAAVQRLEMCYSNIYVVVNSQNGPTSKGQMLNEISNYIAAKEIVDKKIYDIFMLHDSEDIIHPTALKLVNFEMEKVDFLQTPVFSLPAKWSEVVRAIYIDEFTECHTKDMLVRSFLRGGIPSAGVGTAMSHLFVSEIKQVQGHKLLKEDTLTEDYHLGIMAHRLGYASKFVCYYIQKKNRLDYIATREHFPAKFKNSIRQKTRWALGINFQGLTNLKWAQSWSENYFLWRDRRSILNAIVLVLAYGLALSYLGYYVRNKTWPNFLLQPALLGLLQLNFFCMSVRLMQRLRLVYNMYGFKMVALMPLRWLIANVINTIASVRAFFIYRKSLISGERPQWIKTTHELPHLFGAEKLSAVNAQPLETSTAENFNQEIKNTENKI